MALKTIESLDPSPFKHFCVTIGELPSSYLESMTYYEMLAWFCQFLEKTVIPAVNNNGEAVTELQKLYQELKKYVDDYFKNLDVQDEINNKLDQMVESGELQNILTNYREVTRVYDTFEDMIADSTLKENEKVRTIGYYAINDGGGANYLIVSTADENEFQTQIKGSELYAELLIDGGTLNIRKLGAKSNDANFDNSKVIKEAIEKAITNKRFNTIYLPSGYYYVTNAIDLSDKSFDSINIVGDGQNYTGKTGGTVIYFAGLNESYFMTVKGWHRGFVKDLNIVGNNRTNGFLIDDSAAFMFRNINMSNFLNAIYLRTKTAYTYIENCYIAANLDTAVGLKINYNHTDGTIYSQETNTEYIYINNSSFDGAHKNSTLVEIHGAQFFFMNENDFCNSNVAIKVNGAGWKSSFLDFVIKNNSFVHNHKVFYLDEIYTGSSCGRFTIDGHYLPADSKNDYIIDINDKNNNRVSYVTLSGTCENYSHAINVNNVYDLRTDLQGEIGTVQQQNSSYYNSLYLRNNNRYNEIYNPKVTITDNTISYDFSDLYDSNNIGMLFVRGEIPTAVAGTYVNIAVQFATRYSEKVVSYTATNLPEAPTYSKLVLTVKCNSKPTASTSNLHFYLLPL